jgi:hypothetical protein
MAAIGYSCFWLVRQVSNTDSAHWASSFHSSVMSLFTLAGCGGINALWAHDSIFFIGVFMDIDDEDDDDLEMTMSAIEQFNHRMSQLMDKIVQKQSTKRCK